MGSSQALVVAIFVLAITVSPKYVEANFYEHTYFNWGANHSSVTNNGSNLELVLDKNSGSGIQTKHSYLFGSFEMQIKLVAGNSAGTVTAYYLSSKGSAHDEIDFEFLGNVSGKPYIIHTNIFAKGVGNREMQFHPWYDPTADFHNYTIHWNPTEVVWYIDSIPIRVFRNYESDGIAYPNRQGMSLYSSLWNADDWATQGGRVKIDWTLTPFKASYRHFNIRACKWKGLESIYQCPWENSENWYTSNTYKQLSYDKQGQMKWVQDNYMIYNYCKDAKRFQGKFSPECYKPQY